MKGLSRTKFFHASRRYTLLCLAAGPCCRLPKANSYSFAPPSRPPTFFHIPFRDFLSPPGSSTLWCQPWFYLRLQAHLACGLWLSLIIRGGIQSLVVFDACLLTRALTLFSLILSREPLSSLECQQRPHRHRADIGGFKPHLASGCTLANRSCRPLHRTFGVERLPALPDRQRDGGHLLSGIRRWL
jgi:hypothetical protein